jgi:hypothetical protein
VIETPCTKPPRTGLSLLLCESGLQKLESDRKSGSAALKMSSVGIASVDGEPPRKRVRKGTRSCWECKATS